MPPTKRFKTIRSWSYYKISDKHREYKGVRFFKVDAHSDTVIATTLSMGDQRRGTGNMIGITVMSKLNWYPNFLAHSYAVPCKKQEFNNAFKLIIDLLSND